MRGIQVEIPNGKAHNSLGIRRLWEYTGYKVPEGEEGFLLGAFSMWREEVRARKG